MVYYLESQLKDNLELFGLKNSGFYTNYCEWYSAW